MFVRSAKILFSVVLFNLIATKCNATEFIPVYIWESQQNVARPTSALQRINENSFKDSLMERLDTKPFLVVFSEETLSPEDFAQHDQTGSTLFKNLHEFLESGNAVYKPYVQNPIGVIKQLGKGVTEISLASLLRNFDVPKDDILVVDLNDAKDGEQRSHMLRRHDAAISKIFKKLNEDNDSVLAIYTAHHTSWVTPEEVKHRNARSLLQEPNNTVEDKTKDTVPEQKNEGKAESIPEEKVKDKGEIKGLITDDKHLLVHVTSTPIISEDEGKTFQPINLVKDSVKIEGDEITLQLTGDGKTFTFIITLEPNGYWKLSNVTSGNTDFQFPDVSAPVGFSYHCFNVTFTAGKKMMLQLPGLQIEPFKNSKEQQTFDDAFNCVGFTSIPIWTGIFVTAILLLILTFGITLMMDIKTMDKFDDAKGKTITINAGE